MDLTTVTEVLVARDRRDLMDPRPGDAVLAGGTALFGQPADQLRRLVDVTALGWPALSVQPDGLHLAATCTVADLAAFEPPVEWGSAARLIQQCCDAFLASFKIWNRGTVGGNICQAYPAGPMISLAAACDGTLTVWRPDGSDYRLSVLDFVLGDTVTVLQPGEVLREIVLPTTQLAAQFAFRKLALAPLGRSAAVVIARANGKAEDAAVSTTIAVTASTRRPYLVRVPAGEAPTDLADRIDHVVMGDWVDDVYGAADWRRHITGVLAQQVLTELAGRSEL